MRRLAALASCTLLLLAGCGDGGEAGPSVPAASAAADRAAVQGRVATYLRHYAAGDGERSCAQFTSRLRERSDRLAAEAGDGSCAATLSALGPAIVRAMPAVRREAFVRALGDPAAVGVELRGDRALASVQGGTAKRLGLARDGGGRWLIDDLGVPAG